MDVPDEKRGSIAEQRTSWRWALSHVPAILLGLVRAATVTFGAMLLRGDEHQWVLGILGLGVAGLAFDIERKVADKLNSPLNPHQSWFGLLPSFFLVLGVATTLNAITAFEVVQADLRTRVDQKSVAEYWHREGEQMRRWLADARAIVDSAVPAKQREIDAEQAAVNAARRAGTPIPSGQLFALRRDLAALRSLAAELSKVEAPGLNPPTQPREAAEQLTKSLVAMTSAYAKTRTVVPGVRQPPAPAVYEAPPTDLQTLFVNETRAMTSRARLGWGIALVIELLNFVAIWRGGRRTAMEHRMQDWKDRWAAGWSTALRKSTCVPAAVDLSSSLSFRVEPYGLSGTIRHSMGRDLTPADCLPLLEEALCDEPALRGTRINRLTTTDGKVLEAKRPVWTQLDGAPLVAVVEEA